MESFKYVKKIRNYAIVSFLIPLIAINACFLVYKFFGDMRFSLHSNFNYNKAEHTYAHHRYHPIHIYSEYHQIVFDLEKKTFTNCPKYTPIKYWTSIDGKIIPEIIELDTGIEIRIIDNTENLEKLWIKNKLISVTIKNGKTLNYGCVKNYPLTYSLLNKYSWLETLFKRTIENNVGRDGRRIGFAKIKNPYLYGEVSISRTARYFPAVFIFKPLIILSAFFLFLYWRNNLIFFTELKNKNVLSKFSKKFFYFGLFSCIFLTLHATFLGLNIDSILFDKARRLIIILFILLEVFAQIALTKNLFQFKEELKNYINSSILKIKITFVIIILLITCLALIFLTLGDPSTSFKHILEWNYFSFLLIYYLLSRLLWKQKNHVHTPEGA